MAYSAIIISLHREWWERMLPDEEAAGSICRGQREAVVGLAYNTAERICKDTFIAGSRHEESPAVVVLFRRCGMKCRYCGAEIKPEKKERTGTSRRDGKSVYIVQKGDTLWNICGGRADAIKRVAKKNGLATPYGPIFPGQELEL